MKLKLFPVFVFISAAICVMVLLSFINSTSNIVFAAGGKSSAVESGSLKAIADPVTVITVTSGTDPDDSKSKTCYTGSSATAPCTLRRAIVESRNLSDSQRPVLIKFDIPAQSSEGYDSSLKIWKINVYPTTDTAVFRRLNGDIIIDGSTQPGGRNTGPKIMLVGPGTGNKDGFIVGDVAGDNGHEIRGFGFKNFKTHMYVNTANNVIEDNWFGLSDDGTAVYLRNDEPEDGSGSAAIAMASGSTGNTIQANVFLGFDGVAVAMRGDSNTFSMNYVGTNSNGTVPGKETDPQLICTQEDWLGGGGISVDGDDHVVEDNIFAGLRQEIFVISTQPSAIQVGGDGHTVNNNKIGVDFVSHEVGVCGRGIYLISDPEDNQISDNTIVFPGLSGISLNGALYDANTLRRNTIKARSGWTEVEGNAKPEDAIQLGAGLPDGFEYFKPAMVTDIDGTSVNGDSGVGSPCPGCVVELFLDDTDLITEALQSLAVVTAGSDGKWTANIPSNLSANQGIRTTSTSMKFNTIPNMSAGTTTGLSLLYTEGGGTGGGNQLYMPLVVNNKN